MGKVPIKVICEHCGGHRVYALRNSERVLIRCEDCKQRIFAYYADHRTDETPPAYEDADLVRQVERGLLEQVTAPAQALYELMRRYMEQHGYAPTVREMGREMGWASPTTVRYHLQQLEAVGLIERDYGAARGIRLLYAA